MLTRVDKHSRYCPGTDPRFSFRGEVVVRALEHVCGRIGYLKTFRVDNGSEFISRKGCGSLGQCEQCANTLLSPRQTDNGFIETFDS